MFRRIIIRFTIVLFILPLVVPLLAQAPDLPAVRAQRAPVVRYAPAPPERALALEPTQAAPIVVVIEAAPTMALPAIRVGEKPSDKPGPGERP